MILSFTISKGFLPFNCSVIFPMISFFHSLSGFLHSLSCLSLISSNFSVSESSFLFSTETLNKTLESLSENEHRNILSILASVFNRGTP